jgi:hypothetical protein
MVNVQEHTRGGAPIAAHTRNAPGAIVGGEFVAKEASPQARHFILMARALMYSDGMEDALRKAVAGGQYLSDGAVPFLSQLIVQLANKARIPLTDEDMHTVVVHLAGSLVDLADKLGRPSAKDKRGQVEDIVEGVMAVLSGKVAAMARQAQGGSQGTDNDADGDGQLAPLLASAANG